MSKIRQLVKQYGTSALVTYSAISLVSFSSITLAIHLGVDLQPFIDKFKEIKQTFYKQSEEPEKINQPEIATETADSFWGTLGPTLVTAVIFHKLLLPVRLGLTGSFTPRVYKALARIFPKPS
jgi:hypothetical protein